MVVYLVWLGWVEDARGRGDAVRGWMRLLQVSVWPTVVACGAGRRRRRPCSPVLALLPGSPAPWLPWLASLASCLMCSGCCLASWPWVGLWWKAVEDLLSWSWPYLVLCFLGCLRLWVEMVHYVGFSWEDE